MVSVDTRPWHSRDPFCSLNGGEPRIYAPRRAISQRVDDLLGRLGAERFSPGIALVGARGSGKTVELHRIRDRLLDRGIAPVYLNLAHFHSSPGEATLAARLLRELRRTAAAPPPRPSGRTTLNAKLKAPFAPLEVGVTHELAKNELDADAETEHHIRELSASNGLAFLLDEGDCLGDEEFEQLLLDPVAEAASLDLPITVVTAGTSIRYLRAVTGGESRSYAPRLVPPLMIPRLSEEGSKRLLIETAALGEQSWNGGWVDAIVEAGLGLPRWLQHLGSRMFGEIASGFDPQSAAGPVIDAMNTSKNHMYHAGLGPAWDDALLISQWRPDGTDWYELVRALASSAGHSFAESECSLDRVLTSGLIEVDADWRVFLVDRLSVSRPPRNQATGRGIDGAEAAMRPLF